MFEYLLCTNLMDGLLSNIIYALLRKAFKQNFQLLDLFINKKMGKVCKESECLVRKKTIS